MWCVASASYTQISPYHLGHGVMHSYELRFSGAPCVYLLFSRQVHDGPFSQWTSCPLYVRCSPCAHQRRYQPTSSPPHLSPGCFQCQGQVRASGQVSHYSPQFTPVIQDGPGGQNVEIPTFGVNASSHSVKVLDTMKPWILLRDCISVGRKEWRYDDAQLVYHYTKDPEIMRKELERIQIS